MKIDDESFDKAQDKPDDQFAKAVGAKDLANLKEIVRRDLESLRFAKSFAPTAFAK